MQYNHRVQLCLAWTTGTPACAGREALNGAWPNLDAISWKGMSGDGSVEGSLGLSEHLSPAI